MRCASPTAPSTASPPGYGARISAACTASSSGLKAGTVWVNTYGPTDVRLPWGGSRDSGFGREHGDAAHRELHRAQGGVDQHRLFEIRIGAFAPLGDEAVDARGENRQRDRAELEHRVVKGADIEARAERLLGLARVPPGSPSRPDSRTAPAPAMRCSGRPPFGSRARAARCTRADSRSRGRGSSLAHGCRYRPPDAPRARSGS